MQRYLMVLTIVLGVTSPARAQVVPYKSSWEYLMTVALDENNNYFATNPFMNSSGVDFSDWAEIDFDTSQPLTTEGRTIQWQTGNGRFGSGDFGVDYGTPFEIPLSGNRDATHYFRHEFTTDTELSKLVIRAEVDDGAVFYLDGVRVSSMRCCRDSVHREFDPMDPPDAEIAYRERASGTNGPCGLESVPGYDEIEIALAAGRHVLSASVHSASANSADMRFDARVDTAESNEFVGSESGGTSNPWGIGYGEVEGIQCELPAPAWSSGFAPKGRNAIARLLSEPTTPSTVSIESDTVVGGFVFDNQNQYTLSGPGQFQLSASPSSLIDVLSGSHVYQADLSLQNPLEVEVRPGTRLELDDVVRQNDHEISIAGGGTVAVNGLLDGHVVVESDTTLTGAGQIMSSIENYGIISPGNDGIGTLLVGSFQSYGESTVLIEIGESANDLLVVDGSFGLQGRLEVDLVDGFMPSAGDEFTVFEFDSRSIDYSELDLPQLSPGLSWDVFPLEEGKLRVVPEPSGTLALFFGAIGFAFCRAWFAGAGTTVGFPLNS